MDGDARPFIQIGQRDFSRNFVVLGPFADTMKGWRHTSGQQCQTPGDVCLGGVHSLAGRDGPHDAT
jgi:hypothetical protein